MFEREIKFIYNFTINKTEKIGSYFTYEKLASIDIHPAILQYISAEIDYLIFEDRQKLLKNSAFDYSGENINKHFSNISEEIKKSKKFSFEYFKKLILYASSFNVNYLVRPRWALIKFLFDGEGHKSSAEIKQILNYLHFYKYQKKILSSYLNRKKILSINVSELEELLKKIDKLGLESYKKTMIDIALKSIAEFFNIGGMRKDKIPLQAIELFLQEKSMTSHIEQLKRNFPGDDKQSYLVLDIKNTLDKVLSEETELVSAKEENLFESPASSDVDEFQEDKKDEDLSSEYIVDEQLASESEITEEPMTTESSFEESVPGEEIIPTITSSLEEDTETIMKNSEDDFGTISEELPAESTETPDQLSPESVPDESESMPEEELYFEDEEQLTITESEPEDLGLSEEEFPAGLTDEFQKEPESEFEEQVKFELFDETTEQEQELIEDEFPEEDRIAEEEIIEDIKTSESAETDQPDELQKNKVTSKMLDISDLLEHKNMTKIIEVVFDYDMEEFASLIEKVSSCENKGEAIDMLNNLFEHNRVNPSSKEAESFKMIIEEYFDRS